MLGYEEIFELIDVDRDGKFCWTDIDHMSLDETRRVATNVATKLILMFGQDILAKNATLAAEVKASVRADDEL